MSEHEIRIDTTEWINRIESADPAYVRRQVTEIILHAISTTPFLSQRLYLKGGVLMGLVYHSPRQTVDIDFSASQEYSPNRDTASELCEILDNALIRSAATLGYVNTILKVQSIKEYPRRLYLKAKFPALVVKIGFAIRNTFQEAQLEKGQSSNVIGLDISFKEKTGSVQILKLTTGNTLLAYSLTDMIAEKYRALLEQTKRNRYRRQDVYDLSLLISVPNLDITTVYDTLIQKCESKSIHPALDSINDPELKRRASSEWESLELEISDLPKFETCFERIVEFYYKLPWVP